MTDDNHVSTTILTRALQKKLGDVIWAFIRLNWKWVIGIVAGFVIGYSTLEWRLHSALEAGDRAMAAAQAALKAADRVEQKIDQLATKSDVAAVNQRIDDWQVFLSDKAKEPPHQDERKLKRGH